MYAVAVSILLRIISKDAFRVKDAGNPFALLIAIGRGEERRAAEAILRIFNQGIKYGMRIHQAIFLELHTTTIHTYIKGTE